MEHPVDYSFILLPEHDPEDAAAIYVNLYNEKFGVSLSDVESQTHMTYIALRRLREVTTPSGYIFPVSTANIVVDKSDESTEEHVFVEPDINFVWDSDHPLLNTCEYDAETNIITAYLPEGFGMPVFKDLPGLVELFQVYGSAPIPLGSAGLSYTTPDGSTISHRDERTCRFYVPSGTEVTKDGIPSELPADWEWDNGPHDGSCSNPAFLNAVIADGGWVGILPNCKWPVGMARCNYHEVSPLEELAAFDVTGEDGVVVHYAAQTLLLGSSKRTWRIIRRTGDSPVFTIVSRVTGFATPEEVTEWITAEATEVGASDVEVQSDNLLGIQVPQEDPNKQKFFATLLSSSE